eukprot:c34914_g1_i1 orf=1-180(-)
MSLLLKDFLQGQGDPFSMSHSHRSLRLWHPVCSLTKQARLSTLKHSYPRLYSPRFDMVAS